MDSCLFCTLSKVEESKVYENEKVFVIVDRYPYSDRHLLIISKEHQDLLHKLDDDMLASMVTTAKFLAQTLKMEKYNLVQNNINGQIIMHVHMHLIEANESGRLCTSSPNKTLKLSDDEYSTLVSKIKSLL